MKLLEIKNLHAGYGRTNVLHGISFSVEDGSIAVLLGANGAGKTTTLRAISGLTRTEGEIALDGESILGMSPDRIARRGVAHCVQGRGTFTDLTVAENLQIGAFRRNDKNTVRADQEHMFDLFPRLRERAQQKAGSLSGGEQQMLAVARALMLRPRLLLLDEPSLGLAPVIVNGLYEALHRINNEMAVNMLIVEQNANLALELARNAYVLEAGEIVFSGSAREIASHENIRAAYLG
jgi:branched-chain amino acid transport system ATP-binding protein